MTPAYPVFVFSKDDGRLMLFESHEEIEGSLEPIDIRNSEYEAWDAQERPLELIVREGSGDISLLEAVRKVARRLVSGERRDVRQEGWLEIGVVTGFHDPALRSRIVSLLRERGVEISPELALAELVIALKRHVL